MTSSEELSSGYIGLAAEARGCIDDLLELRTALAEQHPAVAAAAEEAAGADTTDKASSLGKHARETGSDVDVTEPLEVRNL